MPTKKKPSPREQEIANKKNDPISKSNRKSVAQNGEEQPPRKGAKNL
jgi:hypothetical protein